MIKTTTTKRQYRRRAKPSRCICEVCGKPFTALLTTRAKFCGNACRQIAKRERDAATAGTFASRSAVDD